jgi:hypothetical protein
MVAQIKGRDMLIGRYAELLGVTAPAGQESDTGR